MLFRKKDNISIDLNNIPRHIAIIMDGNGRWAKKRGMPRKMGHKAGAETFRRCADYLNKVGVKYLSVYAFSTENWKRPEDEVSSIISLFEEYLKEAIIELEKKNIALNVFGDLTPFSDKIKDLVKEAKSKRHTSDGVCVNLCVNYGGRAEILRAVKQIVTDNLSVQDITESELNNRLYTGDIPDPELIIRPGGELRVSNFLLWQCAYSEFYFTDTLWPDMDEKEINKAILSFQNRNRRFGGV